MFDRLFLVAGLLFSFGPFAKLRAQTWSPVGSGSGSAIYALEVFNGELYAGGTFTEIGDATSNYLAKWNGSTWGNVANLINFMAADGLYANDTALFIGDSGRVRFWNGSNLLNLTGVNSSSFNSSVYSLAHFQDTLYVGGFFSTPFARVAKWNGSAYESLTSGCSAQVSAITPYQDQLFIGGNFLTAGDSLVRHTALWNGSEWNRMGDGVNDDVFTRIIWRDTLYIGGRFTQANGQTASHVAKWNGSQWVRVGGILNDYVTSMAVYRDELYIGGAFTTPTHIAKLSGTTWVAVGGGCNDNVRTMDVFHDSLFVGGSFTTAGGVEALRIAKWHTPAPPMAAFTVEDATLCNDGCTTFLDASSNAPDTYTWSFSGGVPESSDLPSPTVCYPTIGSYPVSLTVTNSGGSSTVELDDVILVELCSGIHAVEAEARLRIAPNPAQDHVRIQWDTSLTNVRVTVRDVQGRVVDDRYCTGTSLELAIGQWVDGVYEVAVKGEGLSERVRLVVGG
jgi:PKD repeat protein